MSEAKRVSLQSIGPAKKDKKVDNTSSTIRLNLTLPPYNEDTYAEFNYKSLIVNEIRKGKNKEKEDGKVNGFEPLDPYASDDEDKLKQMARSFESKYGTPKKKYRRLEDYTELGTGYDENDSFIDNTDAFDEAVPEDQTTECGGFYINKGQLVLKRVDGQSSSERSDSDSSDAPQNNKGQKRTLESDSESGSSGSSSGSSESDDSEDSEEDEEEENEPAEVDTDDTPQDVKESKTNGHPAPKKLKLSDFVKCPEVSSKKTKNKAITGLFLKKALSEKEHNEKRQKLEIDGEAKRISNLDAAIEAVARGEDSKESGIAESKSHSDLSDSYDSDDSQSHSKVNGQANGLQRPLPDNLPEKLLKIISALKAKAAENCSKGKEGFFCKEVNALLLSFEKNVRHVPLEKRGLIYDHLQCHLPCSKESLLEKGNALLMESVETAVKEPLSQLKAGIDSLMPNAMERYNTVCRTLEIQRSLEAQKEHPDSLKPSPEKTRIPRRRFPWTEDLKSLLCLVVRKRRIYFHVTKVKGDSWDDHLREFFKKDVLPMWENGWMKLGSLMDILAKLSPDLLNATPSHHEDKSRKSMPLGVGLKKSGPKPGSGVPAVPPSSSPSPSVAPPPPLPSLAVALVPVSSPSQPLAAHGITCEAVATDTTAKKRASDVLVSAKRSATPQGDSLLDLSSPDSTAKKSQCSSNSSSSVPTSVAHPLSQNNLIDITIDELMGNKISSLSNSVSVSVKPLQSSSLSLQCNVTDTSSYEVASNKRNSQGNTASSFKTSHINNGIVDVLNLKSQNNISDLPSSDYAPNKRPPAQHSGSSGVKEIHSSNVKSSHSSQSLETQRSQSSNIVLNSALVNTSHVSYTPLSQPSTIKVSSVAAINLKLSSQGQQQTSQPSTHSMKTSNVSNVMTTSSSKQQPISTFSAPSVISHSMEAGGPSLTITPVISSAQGKAVMQQNSISCVSSSSSFVSSSQSSSSVRSERAEVIVNMPHIKSNPVTVSLQQHRPDSAINYSNSVIDNAGVRKQKPNPSQNDSHPLVKNQNLEKSPFVPPYRSSNHDKTIFKSPHLWSSPCELDSSSSTVGSSPKPSPLSEKVLVSRKDRILQESRDRGVIDSSMPTLSGPYRSSTSSQDPIGSVRHQQARTSASQNLPWDDDLFIVEDFFSTPPKQVHPLKVSTATMDSYKHKLPVLEPQRCDQVKSQPPILESQRAKSMVTSSNNESQRVNVVMQNPISLMKDVLKPSSVLCVPSHDHQKGSMVNPSSVIESTRGNVVVTTSAIQDPLRVNTVKDEMTDILASIPTQMISRTDHYTITNSVQSQQSQQSQQSHHSKRSGLLSNISDMDIIVGEEPKEETRQTAQELAMRGTLMSRTNCDANYPEDSWGPAMKKTSSTKSSSDMSDQRHSGMSGLGMSGLDGMSLGLPPHLVGYQNDYQRHLYGSTSKSGPNDHRPS